MCITSVHRKSTYLSLKMETSSSEAWQCSLHLNHRRKQKSHWPWPDISASYLMSHVPLFINFYIKQETRFTLVTEAVAVLLMH